MKSKTEYYSGKVIEYVPPEALSPNYNSDRIIEAISFFEKNGILPLRINIEKRIRSSKTATSNNLNKLIKSKRIFVKYAKVKMAGTTVISGIYHLAEYDKKRLKK